MDLTCVVFIPANWECLWSKCFGKIFSKCFVTWGTCLIIAEAKIYVSSFNNCSCSRREGMNVKLSSNPLDPFGLLVEYLSTMASGDFLFFCLWYDRMGECPYPSCRPLIGIFLWPLPHSSISPVNTCNKYTVLIKTCIIKLLIFNFSAFVLFKNQVFKRRKKYL